MRAFRRSLFGYRRSDVDEALASQEAAIAHSAEAVARHQAELGACQARIMQLELVCDELSDRVVSGRRELEAAQLELARLEARGRHIEAIADQARGQATRIRMAALGEAADLAVRLREIEQAPATTRARLLESLQIAIDRIGADSGEVAGLHREIVIAAESNGRGRPRDEADEIFEGLVQVEVGPLADFSQLVGFEDAAGAIGATSEISVRRFARGRATLEMRLDEPVELLRELEERAPFDFSVRDRRFDRLVLDVDAE